MGLDLFSPALTKGGSRDLSQWLPCPILCGRISLLEAGAAGRTQTTLQNQELILFGLLLSSWIFSGSRCSALWKEVCWDSIYHALINRPRGVGHGIRSREGPWDLLGNSHLNLGAEAQSLLWGSGRPSSDTHGRLAAVFPLVLSDPASYSSFLWLTLFLNDITFSISLMVLCPSA